MKVEKIITGIYEENCYLLINDDKTCLIIDPGAQPDKIMNKITHLSLEPKAIILTHGHFDHTGAANTLADKYGLCTYFHELDEYLVTKLYGDLVSVHVPEVLKHYKKESIKNYQTFTDTLAIEGFDLNIHHLPGHTQGSVCFEITEENILFTGDFLFKGTIGRTDFSYSNPNDMLASVRYAKSFHPSLVVYSGHGDITTIAEELKTNEFFLKY